MLRPADNVRLKFAPGDEERGWLVLEMDGGEYDLRRATAIEFQRILQSSSRAPHLLATVIDLAMWMFQEEYFWDDNQSTQAEVHRQIAWRLPAG
jgi:hypothetical protein